MRNAVELLKQTQLRIAAIFLVIFLFAVIIQVLTRYLPIFSAPWTEEVATYSFIWAVFMGAAVMVRYQEHFSMGFIVEKMPDNIQKIIRVLNHTIIFTFGIVMVYYGYILTENFWGWSLSSLPTFKQGYVWMSIPVSGITIAIYSLQNLIDTIIVPNKHEGGEQRW